MSLAYSISGRKVVLVCMLLCVFWVNGRMVDQVRQMLRVTGVSWSITVLQSYRVLVFSSYASSRGNWMTFFKCTDLNTRKSIKLRLRHRLVAFQEFNSAFGICTTRELVSIPLILLFVVSSRDEKK